MHDLDGSASLLRQNEYEFNFESEGESESENESFEQEGPLGEAETMELAAELLEVQDEQELEQFLGDVVKKVGSAASGAYRAASNFAASPTGQALVGILKEAAKKALPVVGTALGTSIAGPIGGTVGGYGGKALGGLLGLELEGLSHEDQHFEVAQQFVRLAGETAQAAAAMRGAAGTPEQKAKAAFIEAAKTYAPGLIRPTGRNGTTNGVEGTRQAAGQGTRHSGKHSGRWVRRHGTIVLMGV